MRKVFLNRVIPECSSTARSSASITCGTVPISPIISVLLKEIQKVGSVVISSKFLKPTYFIGPKASHLKNDK